MQLLLSDRDWRHTRTTGWMRAHVAALDAAAPQAAYDIAAAGAVERDGVTHVTMTEPAADPAIDAAMLAALRQWRFRPTFVRGHSPIDSTVEVRLTLAVK